MTQRKYAALVLFFIFLTSQAVSANAATGKGPVQKLARGFTHIVLSPLQIPKQVIQTAVETDPFYLGTFRGMTLGAGNGLYQMGRQLVSGFFDIFTFPTPAGRDWAPLFEPSSLFPEI